MLRTYTPPKKLSPIADLVIALSIATAIYALVAFGREWQSDFQPSTQIDLSAKALPIYSLFSAMRALSAYVLSLTVTLIVGYWAAKSKRAERIILPLLDILQSIPVLGFLPGLVLGLIAVFPNNNVGLELAAVIMIFTGQVWNMVFSYYSSLRSVPADLVEASRVMGLTWWQRLLRLELPFSAVDLAWNSVLSMAGGWFFLSICEAFRLGDRQFRLPGLGAYMAVAIDQGDVSAMVMGVCAMIIVIVVIDFLIWRPVLAWVHRFRLEDIAGVEPGEPLVQLMLRQAVLYWWFRDAIRTLRVLFRKHLLSRRFRPFISARQSAVERASRGGVIPWRILAWSLGGMALVFMARQLWLLTEILAQVRIESWWIILKGTLFTALRVFAALTFSSLWAVPVGIWIGMSSRRVRVAQPVIQILATFPAPMLYPLAVTLFVKIGLDFSIGSLFLMMLGVQWYVLFNVLAGAMRIPRELQYAAEQMGMSMTRRWTALYLPSVYPSLVTGWVAAAGGAWNASIVAEYISYQGKMNIAPGLGSTLSAAAEKADFQMLAASLAVMVLTVVLLNRTLWAKVYRLAQTRYRMDV